MTLRSYNVVGIAAIVAISKNCTSDNLKEPATPTSILVFG